jgi:hypothetical protein
MTKIIRNYDDLVNFFRSITGTDFTNSYSMTFLKSTRKRTIPQNKLYWLYLACIEQETGNDANDLHIYFKDKFLNKELINVLGKQIVKEPTTAKLKTKAFNEYLEKIVIFASELNIKLPNPDDLQMDSFIEHYSKYTQ